MAPAASGGAGTRTSAGPQACVSARKRMSPDGDAAGSLCDAFLGRLSPAGVVLSAESSKMAVACGGVTHVHDFWTARVQRGALEPARRGVPYDGDTVGVWFKRIAYTEGAAPAAPTSSPSSSTTAGTAQAVHTYVPVPVVRRRGADRFYVAWDDTCEAPQTREQRPLLAAPVDSGTVFSFGVVVLTREATTAVLHVSNVAPVATRPDPFVMLPIAPERRNARGFQIAHTHTASTGACMQMCVALDKMDASDMWVSSAAATQARADTAIGAGGAGAIGDACTMLSACRFPINDRGQRTGEYAAVTKALSQVATGTTAQAQQARDAQKTLESVEKLFVDVTHMSAKDVATRLYGLTRLWVAATQKIAFPAAASSS